MTVFAKMTSDQKKLIVIKKYKMKLVSVMLPSAVIFLLLPFTL